jgi:EmrB/QacA subfamily drug resistance transporter
MAQQQVEATADTPPGAVEGAAGEQRPVRSAREIRLVMVGLVITMMLAMLDNLIVGTAMPTIVGDLHGANHLSWVVTSYTLATAAATPIWGKLGDLYGRKGTFLTSIVIFLIGSALAGLSQNMNEMIAFRALQGLGAGGLMVGVMSIMGALVSPRERGKYQGMFAAVMALATIGGPLLGGFITDHFSWHWIFYINLPLGAVALAVVMITLHLPKVRSNAKVDYLGAALLTIGITSLVLITTWGGTQYAWGSKHIIGLIVLAAASLIAFCYVEARVQEPMLPLGLFRNRDFTVVSIVGFIVGFQMFGGVTFLPQYQQIVQGASATNSGLLLMPMMFGMLVVSLVVGQVVTKTGKYRIFPIMGGLIMAVGMFLLSRIGVHTSRWQTGIDYVVLGLGMGFMMQMMSLIAQNSVELKDMGVASSARMFFQQMGGSLGVAAFGAVFAHKLTQSLGSAGSAAGTKFSSSSLDPATVTSLPPAVRDVVYNGIAHAVQTVFLGVAPSAVVIFLLALLIKEVPLRGRGTPGEEVPAPEAEALIG